MSQQPDPTPQPVIDPNGPPHSLEYAKHAMVQGLSLGAKMVLGGAAVFVALAAIPTRTMGALRSQRVKWQEREKQIETVRAKCDADVTKEDAVDSADAAVHVDAANAMPE